MLCAIPIMEKGITAIRTFKQREFKRESYQIRLFENACFQSMTIFIKNDRYAIPDFSKDYDPEMSYSQIHMLPETLPTNISFQIPFCDLSHKKIYNHLLQILVNYNLLIRNSQTYHKLQQLFGEISQNTKPGRKLPPENYWQNKVAQINADLLSVHSTPLPAETSPLQPFVPQSIVQSSSSSLPPAARAIHPTSPGQRRRSVRSTHTPPTGGRLTVPPPHRVLFQIPYDGQEFFDDDLRAFPGDPIKRQPPGENYLNRFRKILNTENQYAYIERDFYKSLKDNEGLDYRRFYDAFNDDLKFARAAKKENGLKLLKMPIRTARGFDTHEFKIVTLDTRLYATPYTSPQDPITKDIYTVYVFHRIGPGLHKQK